jgi:hypothetical protein
LGVDGIVVAAEIGLEPEPNSEWELALSTDEGRVFHRRTGSFARVRSVTSLDSRPNEQFVAATISQVADLRNRVEADVDVPRGDRPALLTLARPFFRGYEARLGHRQLAVASYRGLFPIVEVPAGAHGRLVVVYCPRWLVYGSAFAAGSCAILILGMLAAVRDFVRSRG